MSFKIVDQAQPRLNRSELAVPGSNPSLFEKAAKSNVDVIFLDLEDAVAPDEKEQARKNIIEGLNDIDWNNKTMSVRINGLDTHFMYRDVVALIEKAPNKLDLIMIPKLLSLIFIQRLMAAKMYPIGQIHLKPKNKIPMIVRKVMLVTKNLSHNVVKGIFGSPFVLLDNQNEIC